MIVCAGMATHAVLIVALIGTTTAKIHASIIRTSADMYWYLHLDLWTTEKDGLEKGRMTGEKAEQPEVLEKITEECGRRKRPKKGREKEKEKVMNL